MNNVRIPKTGDFYLHFKNKLYQILTVATHSETGEALVIYQALYGDYKTYARPLEMFLSEVDQVKYPEVKQTYRFQYLTEEELRQYTSKEKEELPVKEDEKVIQQEPSPIKESIQTGTDETKRTYRFIDSAPKTLNDFLDADSVGDRLEILHQMRTYVDDFTLDSIAVCLDYVPSGNTLEERYYSICKFLEMKINYESKR